MRPLAYVALGLALVAIDIRTEVLDILPDPVGWALVALGAWRVLARPAAVAAVAAATCSIADAFLPSRFVVVDVVTGEPDPGGTGPELLVFGHVTGLRLALLAATTLAGGAAVWLLLGRLRSRADRTWARRLDGLRWLVVLAWVVPYVVAAVAQADAFDPVWNDDAELAALAGIGALLLTAVVLGGSAGRRWAVVPRG